MLGLLHGRSAGPRDMHVGWPYHPSAFWSLLNAEHQLLWYLINKGFYVLEFLMCLRMVFNFIQSRSKQKADLYKCVYSVVGDVVDRC